MKIDWEARCKEAEAALANCQAFLKEIPLHVLVTVHDSIRLKRLIKALCLDQPDEGSADQPDEGGR